MKCATDLSLYLVTHRAGLSNEEFFKRVAQAVAGGVKVVQLREKQSSAREMIFLAKELLELLRPLGIPLIINDRVDVAHAVGADGVHLGQSDLSVAEARAILGSEAIIGLSVEKLEQVTDCDVDYLAASPVLQNQTKTDCAQPWGFEGLKQLCKIATVPVLAIGGVTEQNAKEMMNCGASGLAIVSAIFDAPCPKSAAERILKEIQ